LSAIVVVGIIGRLHRNPYCSTYSFVMTPVKEYQLDKGQTFLNLAMEGSYVARKKMKMEDEREMLI